METGVTQPQSPVGPPTPGPSPGTAPKPRPGTPRDAGADEPGPDSPSTVFFLKRDAMVSGRARAAQLGPVRSGPALRKRRGEGRRPGEACSGGRRRTGSPGTTCGGCGQEKLGKPRPGRSGDRELTHFLEKSLRGDACALGKHACALRV